MSKTFRPYQPDQSFLLPVSMREWLPDGHLIYFINDVVDQLDLTDILLQKKEHHTSSEERRKLLLTLPDAQSMWIQKRANRLLL